MDTSNKYITKVQQYADTEDYFVEIPDEICKELDWQEGDVLDWQIEGESIIIKNTTKSQQEYRETDFDQVYDNYIEATAYNNWYAIKAEAIRQYA